jgi:hypothetical protein
MAVTPRLCACLDLRLLAVALVLAAACGRAQGGSRPATSNAVDPTTRVATADLATDAGEGALAAQPAPGLTLETPDTPALDTGDGPLPEIVRQSNYNCNTALSYWARDPATGMCRFAAALCYVPIGWAAFQTEEQCRTDCRCQRIEPFRAEPFSPGYAYESLACACAREDCALTLEEEIGRRCPDGGANSSAILSRGCGKLEVSGGAGLFASSAVFDETSGRLIGRTTASDATSAPCLTTVTISGVEFACPQAARCQLCGTGDVLRCD